MLTEKELKEARELCGKATKGEWTQFRLLPSKNETTEEYVARCVRESGGKDFFVVGGFNEDAVQVDVCHTGNGPKGEDNSAFISQSRTLLPKALDAVEKMAKALKVTCETCEHQYWDTLETKCTQRSCLVGEALRDYHKERS